MPLFRSLVALPVAWELLGAAAQDSAVADAPRHAVGVEPLEIELRGLPADPERVAELGERDPVGEDGSRLLVRLGRDREAVADAHEAALLFEETSERSVLDPHRLEAELRLRAPPLPSAREPSSAVAPGR